MRHQLGEGEEVKNPTKKVAVWRILGSEEHNPTTDTVFDDIDPADFIDPEEFGFSRRSTNDQ
jgi:hypothetical protein